MLALGLRMLMLTRMRLQRRCPRAAFAALAVAHRGAGAHVAFGRRRQCQGRQLGTPGLGRGEEVGSQAESPLQL